jgi:glycosyltransferase involved in cell wall biosynthesis
VGEPDDRTGELANNTVSRAQSRGTVGLIADEDPSVLENVIEATDQGFEVIVADTTIGGSSIARIAKRLGAGVFTPTEDEEPVEALRQYLRVRADADSADVVIIATDESRQIDFERTIEAGAATDGIVEAVPRAADETVEVLVGIPAYNEATTVGDVVRSANQYADEVLVVDDASDDDTAAVAREAGATVHTHDRNRGYGGALKTLFAEADRRGAEHLVVIDGDGQHDSSDIPEAVETQQETDADIVIGSRFTPDAETDLPLYRRVGLAIVNSLTNFSMGVIRRRSWVKDTQSGFRTYNRQAITTLSGADDIGEGMHASTDILFHAHERNYELTEIGTDVDYSVENASTHNPVAHGLKLVSNILKTIEHQRPITSLGLPGFASAFAGVGFGYWTFSTYLSSGTFPLGLAITSTFFTLAGIFACFTAIILHSLNTHLK